MSCSRIRVNQGRYVALVIAPTWDTIALQLQACVTEKNQTVMEFTPRTLKEITWTDLTSSFKIKLTSQIFLGLEDRLTLKVTVLKSFDTPVCTSIYQSTRHKNKEQLCLHVENIHFSSRREIILKWILYKNVMWISDINLSRSDTIQWKTFLKHSNEFRFP